MTAVLFLNEVPAGEIAYGMLLCLGILLLAVTMDRISYGRRHRELFALQQSITVSLENLPEPGEILEEDYQRLLGILAEEKMRIWNTAVSEKRDLMEYYTMWVHQIKTPISAMHLLIQSFEEQAMEFEEHAEETLNFLNEMKMKIFQTEEYVGMVLSYLRMEDMGNDLKFQWYPIGDIVRQAVRKYSQIFILKKIHLNFQDSRQMVLTDEKWLLFVIEQVLSNALKYTSSDEIRPPKVQGMGSPDGDTEKGCISIYIKGTELVVEDTGIGIAPEDLPRIFERDRILWKFISAGGYQ